MEGSTEMSQLSNQLQGEVADLRGKTAKLPGELRVEMSELRAELHADVLEVRRDLRALGEKIDRVFSELLHHVQERHPYGPPSQVA